jgi:O-antigen ligase
VAYGLAGLLLLATLGEGGGHPTSMLVWHGWLVALVCLIALRPRDASAEWGTMPREVLIPSGLFLLLFAVGAVRAPYAYGAWLVTLELACCVAVAAIAAGAGSRALTLLIDPLQIGAALQGAWVVKQWLEPDRPRPAGTFLNANHLALWMVAVTLLALGALRAGDRRSDVARRVLFALPAAAAIVLAGSRGAAVGLAAGAGWLVWTRRGLLARGLRVVLVAGIVVILGLVGWRQLERIERHDPFRYQRLEIWQASTAPMTADPWWGTGPGQFSAAAANLRFPDGDGPLRYDRAFSSTHSDLVRLPAEFGIPAALAALVATAVAGRPLAGRRRAGKLPRFADGAVAALIAVAAHGLVDNPSTWPAVYVLASALLGCVLSRGHRSTWRLALAARVGLTGAMLVVFLVADIAPFLAWREMSRPHGGGPGDTDRARLERALRWNPIHPGYWMRLGQQIAGDAAEWDPDAYAAAREAAEHAIRLHPAASRFQLGLARIEAHACRTLFPNASCRERVAARYHRAEQLGRYDPFLPIGLAAFLLDTGDPAGARRAAERALALEPESVLPRLLLADALIEGGSDAGRRRAAELLAEGRERATRWSDWSEGSYGRELLAPAPSVFDRLQRKLESARERVGSGTVESR